MTDEALFKKRIRQIQSIIEQSAAKSGRNSSEIKIVAVSKTKPVEDIRSVYACGLKIFGESKVQEAEDKIQSCYDLNIEWHMVGHLQTNKVKKAVRLFDLIHSVDSMKLIGKIDAEAENAGKIQDILLQVNVSGEESKFGCDPGQLQELIECSNSAAHVRCKGLMAIPPAVEKIDQVRPFFQRLRELAYEYENSMQSGKNRIELSMGMTNDYPVAAEEGATYVRIGTAIFGERQYT